MKEKKDKKVIGLTGTYCAGKNHVAFILEQRGLPVLDVDKLGHRVIEMEKDRLLARFGQDILGPDGFIDRKRLGAKVFGSGGELAALEGIIHPAVDREILDWIKSRKEKACVINAALLHRSQSFGELYAVIVVDAPLHIRLLRAKRRDRLPWADLLKRFQSQKDILPQYLMEKTDTYRVENPGFFSFRSRSLRLRLENRIDEILSLKGIERDPNL